MFNSYNIFMSIFYGHKYGCPKANLESLTGTQPHSPNVNHCILHYLTPGIEWVLVVKLNPEAWQTAWVGFGLETFHSGVDAKSWCAALSKLMRYNLVTSTALLDFSCKFKWTSMMKLSLSLPNLSFCRRS